MLIEYRNSISPAVAIAVGTGMRLQAVRAWFSSGC